ncbi:hypothetical protein Goari_010458, partial [Gossypium aridum]|nr:hypothetical protein [Gossypium aridum]
MACAEAAEMGLQLGFPRVEIEGESLAVIRKLKAEGIERSVIRVYISNIKTTCEQYKKCVFLHVPKHANGAAHSLATKGLKREDTYLFRGVPFYAQKAVEMD